MDRRIETRVVDTADAALTTIIQKDACEVWWISVSEKTPATKGLIQIYDGFDTQGKLQWQLEPSYTRNYKFIPPIPCDQGITVYNDANIASYTIAYRPKRWPREQK
ncbi:hypothetical protein ES708_08755 [subsurface metagenome]